MTADRPIETTGSWTWPEDRTRMIVDADGVEWEVYDEATWSIELALEWDFLPQVENPGLIFSSRVGRRRIWPCPEHWQQLGPAALLELLGRAKSII